MHETKEDLERLQELLDRSVEQAGEYLRSCFQMPQHSLKANQIVRLLQGFVTAAVATVTARGEPRVAPVGTIFYRGQFYIPTEANALRAKHLAARPGISLSFYNANDLAIVVHGRGTRLSPPDGEFETLDRLLEKETGRRVRDWGDGIFIRVAADRFYTFARNPEQFPD
jgi:hypothetical protein